MKEQLLIIIFLIMLTSIFDTIAQLFLKSSINRINPEVNGIKKIAFFIKQLLLTPRIYIGFSFNCISLFLWLYVLSKADLNFAFSLDSMHYIFIAIASSLVLKERVGLLRWMGTLFIVLGITLVTLS